MEESIFLGFNKMQVNFEQQHEQTRGRLPIMILLGYIIIKFFKK